MKDDSIVRHAVEQETLSTADVKPTKEATTRSGRSGGNAASQNAPYMEVGACCPGPASLYNPIGL